VITYVISSTGFLFLGQTIISATGFLILGQTFSKPTEMAK